MRKACLIGVLLLAGCATADDYAGPPGAVAQALSACRLQSDSLPITATAGQQPFVVAAYQASFINQCMEQMGYPLRN